MVLAGLHSHQEALLERDFYGHRLASVNTTNAVIAQENICNQQGVLLVAKGSPLSHNKAELIAKHKLIKPLEHCVNVADSIDAEQLFQHLQQLGKTLTGVDQAINDDVWQALRTLCEYFARFPLLRQKLTVLHHELQQIFNDSLYSALMGTAIAYELALDDEQMRAVFIAGLMHDIGYLNLDPERVQAEQADAVSISRELQAHPIIARHFLEYVEGLTPLASIAVAEHHERTDGTGYPKNKFGTDLCLAGQIVGITDHIMNGYRSCAEHAEHVLPLLLLILQLNDNVHFENVYRAAVKILRRGPYPNTPPAVAPNPQDILQLKKRLQERFNAAKKLGFVLMKRTRNRHTKSIASMIGRLATSIVSSGVMQDEFSDWIHELVDHVKPDDFLPLLKCQIMMKEIEVQNERLMQLMWRSIHSIPENEGSLRENCILSFKQIEKI